MTSQQMRYVYAGGGILIVIGATLLVRFLNTNTAPRQRTLHGTVNAVDPVSRRVKFTLIHPRTGQDWAYEQVAPEDLQISIDGQPATLADVRPGDKLEVDLLMYSSINHRALAARIKRNPTASAPAGAQPAISSQPAGAP